MNYWLSRICSIVCNVTIEPQAIGIVSNASVARIVSVVSAMFPYDRFDRFGVFQTIQTIIWKPGFKDVVNAIHSPPYVQLPNLSEQTCLSKGKYLTLILQVLVKEAGENHCENPSDVKMTFVLYFSSPPPQLSSALKPHKTYCHVIRYTCKLVRW